MRLGMGMGMGIWCIGHILECKMQTYIYPCLCQCQVYEKKVSAMTNFNLENRNGVASSAPKVGAVSGHPAMQKLNHPLRLPKVRRQSIFSQLWPELATHFFGSVSATFFKEFRL
jgi:hypothetical protein